MATILVEEVTLTWDCGCPDLEPIRFDEEDMRLMANEENLSNAIAVSPEPDHKRSPDAVPEVVVWAYKQGVIQEVPAWSILFL